MKNLPHAIWKHLDDNAGVKSEVGLIRFGGRRTQDPKTLLTINQISSKEGVTLQGHNQLVETRIQITALAEADLHKAQRMRAKAIRALTPLLYTVMGNPDGVRVHHVVESGGGRDLYDSAADTWACSQDLTFVHDRIEY